MSMRDSVFTLNPAINLATTYAEYVRAILGITGEPIYVPTPSQRLSNSISGMTLASQGSVPAAAASQYQMQPVAYHPGMPMMTLQPNQLQPLMYSQYQLHQQPSQTLQQEQAQYTVGEPASPMMQQQPGAVPPALIHYYMSEPKSMKTKSSMKRKSSSQLGSQSPNLHDDSEPPSPKTKKLDAEEQYLLNMQQREDRLAARRRTAAAEDGQLTAMPKIEPVADYDTELRDDVFLDFFHPDGNLFRN